MKHRHLSHAFATLCLTLTLAASAEALCVYDPSPPCQAYWRAPVVFVGTVREIAYSPTYQRGEGDDRWNYRRRITRFLVEQPFKGVAAGQVEVVTEEILPTPVKLPDGQMGTKTLSHSDCDYKFEAGEKYFVYAYRRKENDGTLAVGLNRTRKLRDAAEDLEFVNELPRRGPVARIFGSVVRSDRNLRDGNYLRAPVAGVKVVARGAGRSFDALTDAEGRYKLEDLPPGAYRVTAELPAHLSAEGGPQAAEVGARGCAEINFYTAADGRITGRVLDDAGRPLPEVKIDLILQDGPDISLQGLYALTDKEGNYELKGVPAGRYLLGVNLSSAPDERLPHPRTYYPGVGSAAEATAITLAEGERLKDFDLRLLPRYTGRAVEVIVTWPDGRPVNDAGVRLENIDYPWSAAATRVRKLDEQGRYEVIGFEGVTYWVHALGVLNREQRHAEPIKFVMREGLPPFRLVVASPYGNCPHYRKR